MCMNHVGHQRHFRFRNHEMAEARASRRVSGAAACPGADRQEIDTRRKAANRAPQQRVGSGTAQLAGKARSFPIDPPQTPFGLLRVFSVVIPFLYVGTQISKNFAALLEEHDIFVPEDDDDDD